MKIYVVLSWNIDEECYINDAVFLERSNAVEYMQLEDYLIGKDMKIEEWDTED